RLPCPQFRTLVSVLSASVSCRVVRPNGDAGQDMLCVGSSVSPVHCRELLRSIVYSCAALVEKLGDYGRHSYDMLYAVAKTIVLSPNYQCLFLLPYYKEEGEIVSRMGTIAAELINHPSYHVLPSDDSNPPRLLLWHLDPSIIRLDLSVMLKEVIKRPLLCLRKELYNRMEWRIIIICPVCSPTVFMEMRSLLHFWFQGTGLSCVLELHNALVSSALDILLKPIFPFSHAYFLSHQRNLLAILTGPLSCKAFLDLISYISALIDLDNTRTRCSSQKNLQLQPLKGLVMYMIISFPVWFSFATALLFYREGSHDSLSETLSKEPTAESISDVSLVQRAAFYLSWVLCPSNDDQCEMLSNNILEISHSWARNNKKCLSYQITMNHRRKLQIPTAAKSEKFHVPINTLCACVKCCSTTAFPQVQDGKLADLHPSNFNLILHQWIPLGVLLISPSCANEQNCDILLCYTSTGEDSAALIAERWALIGAYLIFIWLDVVEDMSSLIFGCEDRCHRSVSQLRNKTAPYPAQANQDRDFVTCYFPVELMQPNEFIVGCCSVIIGFRISMGVWFLRSNFLLTNKQGVLVFIFINLWTKMKHVSRSADTFSDGLGLFIPKCIDHQLYRNHITEQKKTMKEILLTCVSVSDIYCDDDIKKMVIYASKGSS
ncbi:hypothetical protein ACJX0J_027766, partial [Zea mays]